MIGFVEIATAAASLLAPYLPYAIKAGQAVGGAIVAEVEKVGGEAAWNKAEAIWNHIKDHFKAKPELKQTAELVAMQPENPTYQKVFTETLASYLETKTDLQEVLLNLLGGEKAVQQVLADKGSIIDEVTQELQGKGTQTVKASDHSFINGVKQTIKS
jgi:hypothetical protein